MQLRTVKPVEEMGPLGTRSKAVFGLHTGLVKAHFSILKSLASIIRPEDELFVEHYQTPVILETLGDRVRL